LYASPNIIQMINQGGGMVEACSTYARDENCKNVLTGKREGKRPLEIYRRI